MLPDTKDSCGARIPRFGQPASDFGEIVPLLLVAALASLFLGANTVEIEAIWSLQRRSDRIGPRYTRTGAGGTCKAPALPEKERCRMHGGLSTGPKTPEGKARTLAALKAGFQRWVAERRAQKATSLDDGAAC